MLREHLIAACAGNGGLVLVGGEAGIGKTALAESLCTDAQQHGAFVLVGHCYDLSETPPYGPWTEARSQFSLSPGGPPGSIPPLPDALHTTARSPQQFFAEVRAFFAAAAARQPLLLLLDDMQWADPASLDLLRFLARSLATLPLLLLVNYRPDDLDHHHPFSQLIPLLVREAHAERLDLAPLSAVALRTLVHERYCLSGVDETRLVAYLTRRTEGNALFAHEMLRALEERGVVATGGETLGDLEGVAVPSLLRQIVAGRVARLGAEAERLLLIAAVIGQQAPLGVWAQVGAVDEGAIEAVAERGIAARLLVETPEGVGFAHALIREALYEEVPALRRRRMHRAVGEALAAGSDPAPDTVAYHFRAAGDERATAWLTNAGWRAFRAFAYETAVARFEEALPHLEGTERVRALLALARMDPFQKWGMRYAKQAFAAAQRTDDVVLAAVAQFRLGMTLLWQGSLREALLAMDAATAILDTYPDEALPNLYGIQGLTLPRELRLVYRAQMFACSGQWRQVFALLGGTPKTIFARLDQHDVHAAGVWEDTNAKAAIWMACVVLGRVADTQRALALSHATHLAIQDDSGFLFSLAIEGVSLLLPFLLDDRDARQRYDAAVTAATRRVEAAFGVAPPNLNHCPLLIAAGRWAEARALWASRDEGAIILDAPWILPHIGAMARAQGERDEAWALVHEGLPDGPLTEPGTTYFIALDLHGLAARLTLDDGEHDQARQWLEAHDRWLDWAGPEVRWGRADGHLLWAEYRRALGEPAAALGHAERALAEASAPRQPLVLLAAQRLLGTLATDTGRSAAATAHLEASLALADACAAPYERALTLLALAELALTTGDGATAGRLLAEARALCTPLGARPILERVEHLTERLARRPEAPAIYPSGLSVREVEVLRLIAAGRSNPEIAGVLSLSVRTVERHVENLYRKLDIHGRAEATAYAFRHSLT